MTGLYIHIPFCASRCIYCDFYSTTHSHLQNQYIDALCKEMEMVDNSSPISTIYLGGGTPSQLTNAQLRKLFDKIGNTFRVERDAEITMECNPDDIKADMFAGLPINRVSMGAQTFSDERLRFLRRRHKAADVDQSVRLVREQGIGNISIDLMYGFPNETLDDWASDISHIIELNPEHISAYGLIYEEGTPLFRMLDNGQVTEIDEELSLKMYDTLIDRLTEAGYEHYEISNFAHLGRRSRHNSSYWNNTPYIGLGAAAHSYDITSRGWNVADLKQYIASIENGKRPQTIEKIDDTTRYNDLVVTALRTCEGIAVNILPVEEQNILLKSAESFIKNGLLQMAGNRLRLTRSGIKISNTIMSELMMV